MCLLSQHPPPACEAGSAVIPTLQMGKPRPRVSHSWLTEWGLQTGWLALESVVDVLPC